MRLTTQRLEALSDGVFAIVITLLVLELRAPYDMKELPHELEKVGALFLAFVIVGKFWIQHHIALARADKATPALLWLNVLFLFLLSLVPFPTSVLAEHPAHPWALCLFGFCMASLMAVFGCLRAYVIARLMKPGLKASALDGRIFASFALYLLGGSLALVAPQASYSVFLLSPVVFLVIAE